MSSSNTTTMFAVGDQLDMNRFSNITHISSKNDYALFMGRETTSGRALSCFVRGGKIQSVIRTYFLEPCAPFEPKVLDLLKSHYLYLLYYYILPTQFKRFRNEVDTRARDKHEFVLEAAREREVGEVKAVIESLYISLLKNSIFSDLSRNDFKAETVLEQFRLDNDVLAKLTRVRRYYPDPSKQTPGTVVITYTFDKGVPMISPKGAKGFLRVDAPTQLVFTEHRVDDYTREGFNEVYHKHKALIDAFYATS